MGKRRSIDSRPCERCGQSFHPWLGDVGRFCSRYCSSRGSSIATPVEIRFARLTDRTAGPDQCWLWKGALKSNGYGNFFADKSGRSTRAHRVAWELANGPIPDGLHVCHRCDVRHCVNPAHLFLGTRSDNIQDMLAKGRHHPVRGPQWYEVNKPITHCKRGHPNTAEYRTKFGACRPCLQQTQREHYARHGKASRRNKGQAAHL